MAERPPPTPEPPPTARSPAERVAKVFGVLLLLVIGMVTLVAGSCFLLLAVKS